MEDLEVIRQFINESEFSPEIKSVLLESIGIEVRDGALSEYEKVVKRIADSNQSEN